MADLEASSPVIMGLLEHLSVGLPLAVMVMCAKPAQGLGSAFTFNYLCVEKFYLSNMAALKMDNIQ